MHKDDYARQFRELLGQLETKLGLQEGFAAGLIDEPNDWAFIIQLQVVIEAALAHVIVKALGDERLFDHVSRLNMTGRTGKLTLASQLQLLEADVGRAAEKIVEVRNTFAHRISSLGTSLENFAQALSMERKLDLARGLLAVEPQGEAEFRNDGGTRFAVSLRFYLWLAGCLVLAQLGSAELATQLREAEKEAKDRVFEEWNRSRARPTNMLRNLLWPEVGTGGPGQPAAAIAQADQPQVTAQRERRE